MVSSGTFTTGHLDGKHLSKILNFMNDNSFAVFSVKNDHFEESGFMNELMRLQDEELIQVLEVSEVDSYNNDNYSALSKIVTLKIN
jgi:hypothetical protein